MRQPIALDPIQQVHAPDVAAAAPPGDGIASTSSKKLGLFRRVFRGMGWLSAAPADWLGATHVRRGASAIRLLAGKLRAPAARDRRFKTEPGGGFDLQATAFSYGMSVVELEERLSLRRRQTATAAYATFALAVCFLLGWIHQALHTELTASRLALALYFLPFCLLFFLIAFYNALLNFQIRTRRTAGWREYLTTEKAFLPQ
jgi:hypothetical protein